MGAGGQQGNGKMEPNRITVPDIAKAIDGWFDKGRNAWNNWQSNVGRDTLDEGLRLSKAPEVIAEGARQTVQKGRDFVKEQERKNTAEMKANRYETEQSDGNDKELGSATISLQERNNPMAHTELSTLAKNTSEGFKNAALVAQLSNDIFKTNFNDVGAKKLAEQLKKESEYHEGVADAQGASKFEKMAGKWVGNGISDFAIKQLHLNSPVVKGVVKAAELWDKQKKVESPPPGGASSPQVPAAVAPGQSSAAPAGGSAVPKTEPNAASGPATAPAPGKVPPNLSTPPNVSFSQNDSLATNTRMEPGQDGGNGAGNNIIVASASPSGPYGSTSYADVRPIVTGGLFPVEAMTTEVNRGMNQEERGVTV